MSTVNVPPSRFTPTCVGTAGPTLAIISSWTVHPHVRGDGSTPVFPGEALIGSPPRAWGRPFPCSLGDGSYRFTPTCVGTAFVVGVVRRWSTVHPHVRGDGVQGLPRITFGGGSPPRAWGRLRHAIKARRIKRFTPTCVGTAIPAGHFDGFDAVHPHVRGDGRGDTACRYKYSGSPPRAWGRRFSLGSRG